jgi:hypothetical protein
MPMVRAEVEHQRRCDALQRGRDRGRRLVEALDEQLDEQPHVDRPVTHQHGPPAVAEVVPAHAGQAEHLGGGEAGALAHEGGEAGRRARVPDRAPPRDRVERAESPRAGDERRLCGARRGGGVHGPSP